MVYLSLLGGGDTLFDTVTTNYNSVGNVNSLPTSAGQYREIVLGQQNGKKIVFYQQFTGSSATTNFLGGAFETILLIWAEQASTSDSQSQRTTLSSFTNTSWTAYNAGYKHRINVIGIK